jgi:hypothetical protein
MNNLNKKLIKQSAAQIFISYCRTNSHDAIAKGTPLKSKDSLGWSDPRSLATYLTNEGYSCWIDFEQVGSKKTLFEDIVEGIRSAKVMIACVSNEYAKSDNCMKEFRFASNLKMPIVLCTFGSADCKCEWRSSELGIISCLMKKEINFQLENPNAYQSLLSEIQSFQIAPATKIRKLLPLLNNEQEEDSKKSDTNDTKNKMAYTELFELAQRKFIRQIASYTDTVSSRPFPRLFTIDLMNDDSSSSGNEQLNKQKFSQQLSINNNRLCLKSLCESENGWHLTNCQAIEYEILSNIPEAHFAYLMRIMSLVKESDLDLDVLRMPGKLDEFIVYLEESLQKMNSIEETSFKESYNSIKNYIQLRLEQKNKSISLKKEDEKINQNRIENFKLNRCGMPSGKVLWLCDKHSQNEHVQVLTSNENVTNAKYQNEEVNSILFDELKKYDTFTQKF